MATKAQSKNSKPFSILADSLESAAESFEEATSNAPEAARRAAQTAKRALGKGLYNSFYGISYGLVYSGVFITELLPEKHSIRRALVEGAENALGDRAKTHTAPKRKAEKPAAEKEKAKPSRSKPAAKTSGRVRKIVKTRADQFEAAAEEAAS